MLKCRILALLIMSGFLLTKAILYIINATVASVLTVASLSVGFCGFAAAYFDIAKEKVEMYSARNVVWALRLAERDRAFLKQMRINREEERELMKDYPGWEVGTYFGERIYPDMPEDEFLTPIYPEYLVHTSSKYSGPMFLRNFLT